MRHTLGLSLSFAFGLLSCGTHAEESLPDGFADGVGSVGQAFSSSSNSPGIGAGGLHVCGLYTGGRVMCWGDNAYGQLGDGTTQARYRSVFASGIDGAVAVATGEGHTCALTGDGTVRCWGLNASGQLGNGTTANSAAPVSVTGVTTATAIAAGHRHTCARLSNSAAVCWGANTYGQLGNGKTVDASTPVAASSITSATAVAAGGRHSCARLSDSTVKCWGLNTSGQLGNGKTSNSSTPVVVSSLKTAVNVSTGWDHTCAVASDSTARCWGNNSWGQLGSGSTVNATKPVAVSGLSGATAIGLGDRHSCVRLSNATARCWGDNDSGQLGNGTATPSPVPVTVANLADASQIAGGTDFTCALLASGQVKCWGDNSRGAVGQGTAAVHVLPVLVQRLTLNQVMAVTSGEQHTCGLWSNGSIKCWGGNASGQLGNNSTVLSGAAVDVVGITTATALAAGGAHTCARLADSTVKCWGGNWYGQLGNGSSATATTPVAVAGVATATSVSAGQDHTCALLADGGIVCWGSNLQGQLGNGSTSGSSTTPVSVTGISGATSVGLGLWHGCAVLANGSARCWGRNAGGQLGDNTRSLSRSPVPVSGLTGAVAVSGGYDHSCALMGDGTARCWGQNVDGQLGDGTGLDALVPVSVLGLDQATALSAGHFHTCAARLDKTTRCWGDNLAGQVGDGTTVDRLGPTATLWVTTATAVAAGGYHTCARLADSTLACWGRNQYSEIGNAHVPDFLTPVSLACTAITVERSDYFVNYTTADMPDFSLNNLTASLDVHRVRPVLPTGCSAQKAMVLVHGRTIPSTAGFDLQYEDYSLMESLAMQGIDTFAANHLGMGFSKLTSSDPMTNACNGSRVACTAAQCSPCTLACAQANNCDCPGLLAGLAGMNQQSSTRYLGGGHPLSSTCAHPSPYHLQRVTNQAAELVYIVNDALSKNPGLNTVSLFGWAFGGVTVGKYLGDNVTYAGESMASRQGKVERAIFLATPYAATPGQALSAPESQPPTFPMAVSDKIDMLGGFNTANTCLSGDGCQAQCRLLGSTCVGCAPGAQGCPTSEAGSCDPDCSCTGPNCPCTTDDCIGCPGQLPTGMSTQVWAAVRARDDNPASPPWGPASDYVARYPVVTRFGWYTTATTNIRNAGLPALVMHGKKDTTIDLQASTRLCAALNGGAACIQGQLSGPLLMLQLNCTSHSVPWEGCSGSTCNGWRGPHASLAKNLSDYALTGMLYASPGADRGLYSATGNDGANYHVDAPDEGTSCSCGGAECASCGDGVCPCVDGMCEVCP